MCGIFGLVAGGGSGLDSTGFAALLRRLFLLSESRGKEAAGVAFCVADRIDVVRAAVAASELLKRSDYHSALERALASLSAPARGPLAAIGHARLVTNGLQGIDANNQPVLSGDVVCVHNGIIVNEPQLWQSHPHLQRQTHVDTEVLAAMLHDKLAAGSSLEAAIREVYGGVCGEASVAVLTAGGQSLLLATNTGSLFLVADPSLGAMFYCSEAAIARKIQSELAGGWERQPVVQLKAGEAVTVDLATATVGEHFKLDDRSASSTREAGALATSSSRVSRRSVVTTTDIVRRRWQGMRRCSRCILPESMPFIRFDENGVCNYCINYEKQKLAGEEALLRTLDQYRSRTGEADCLVGFSGGRDSSYGLHLLKTRYGMNPIAYTYDWGMVTDLARRNQARLCGRLGVEHIWVSADIKAKRRNVRRNVEAWFRQPELGMVPLFMAGDKQFMWHANRLMKETGIRLMVYSTNQFERTDFKTGFCGVPPVSAGVRLNKMSAAAKLRLLAYYLKNYALNPGYINGSLSDTFTAFLSYYFVQQDFLYLFDYVQWDEEVINRVLVGEYEWELAHDTPTTWRIGDGTAPFYNYVYQTVAGFSEYETFRSNQIREGVITREAALALVETENKPRFDSIREYCGLIGIDFDVAMRRIEQIPKLY